MLDRLATHPWSDATETGWRSIIAIALYLAAGLCGALLAVFGDGGITRVAWGLVAVVFVALGVTLTGYRSRRH